MSNRAHFFFLFSFFFLFFSFFCVQRDVSKDAKRLRHPGGDPPLFDVSPHHRPKHSSRATRVPAIPAIPPPLPPHSTFRASVIWSTTKSVRTSMRRARSSSFFLVGEPTIVHLRIYRRLPPSASKCALPSPPSFLAHPPNGPPMQNVRVQPVRPPGLADLTAVRPPQAGARTRPLYVAWIGGGCRPKG